LTTLPLVLLSGMDGSGELFGDFVAHLDPAIEPLILRYPADQALGYEALAQRVAAELPLDRPVALLGESFSGPLAVMLAASPAHLPWVRALILSCSFVHNPLPALGQLASLVDLVPINLLPKRLIVDYFLGETRDERLMQKLLEVSARLTPEVWRARAKAALAVDVSAQLRQIEVPILYLRARQDRLVLPTQAEIVKQLAPQTEIVDFDTPHFLLQTAPKRAARVVDDFLQRAMLGAGDL
jgi:pimeloyl-ACP methyl ester carboxylesterase